MSEAERIVRDLAGKDEPCDYEYGDCLLCDKSIRHGHTPDCPWLRAVQWVQANPE